MIETLKPFSAPEQSAFVYMIRFTDPNLFSPSTRTFLRRILNLAGEKELIYKTKQLNSNSC